MTTERSPSDPDEAASAWVYSDVMQPLDVRIRVEVRRQLRAAWLGNFVSCVLGVVLGVAVVLLAQKVGMR